MSYDINISREWLEKWIDLEDDCEVGAGCPEILTPENTAACKVLAEWREAPHSLLYCVRLQPFDVIHEHLGSIKQRADGRWNWWRWKSRYHEWSVGRGQGVALTEEEAKAKVLEGWK